VSAVPLPSRRPNLASRSGESGASGSVAALAGKGLQGDRHFCADGAKPGQALTLIEAEALEHVGLSGAQSRRQELSGSAAQ
jgi:hypothetical protein